VGAGRERTVPDAGDVSAYRDAGQAAVQERTVPDAGDRQVSAPDIDRVGDDNLTTRTSVFRDGDRAVAVVRVIELGLHHSGRPQDQQQQQQLARCFGPTFV
jgi:hypothetical protein